jgi:hypothetical protein
MKIFYAYPAAIVDVKHVIHRTKDGLSTVRPDIELHLWEENDISGRPLTDPIFEGIAESDIFVADVTRSDSGKGSISHVTEILRGIALLRIRSASSIRLDLRSTLTSKTSQDFSKPIFRTAEFHFVRLLILNPRYMSCRLPNPTRQ